MCSTQLRATAPAESSPSVQRLPRQLPPTSRRKEAPVATAVASAMRARSAQAGAKPKRAIAIQNPKKTPQIVPERLTYMTDGWKDAFGHAVRTADAKGLEFAIAASPGWSETGGPWVPPADGMKKLVWSEAIVDGGKAFTKLSNPALQLPHHGRPDHRHAGIAVIQAGDQRKILAAIFLEDMSVLDREFLQRTYGRRPVEFAEAASHPSSVSGSDDSRFDALEAEVRLLREEIDPSRFLTRGEKMSASA